MDGQQVIVKTSQFLHEGLESAIQAGDQQAAADWADTMVEFADDPAEFCRLERLGV